MGKRTRKSTRATSVEWPTGESGMEIVLSDGVRIRLSGEAGHTLLERLLERLSRR
jgi:hypothetical protein